MKKSIGVWAIVLLCFVSIVIGHFYWKQKISKPVAAQADTQESMESNSAQNVNEDIMAYAKNLPETVQKKMKTALKEGRPLNFVIWGSESVSAAQDGWPEKLKEQLEETYGDSLFNITIFSDSGQTTNTVLNEKLYNKVVEQKPDLLLFEPFILKDNGVVGIDNTLNNITAILEQILKANPGVTVMLQPAHRLYGAVHYPKEVEALQQYAKDHGYIYLNHWENWPDEEDEQLKEYVTEDRSKPSEKGNQAWGEYLIDYFVAEDE